MVLSKIIRVGITILTLFLSLKLSAQTPVVENFRNIAGQPFFPSQYVGVNGTPYLFEDWVPSTILLNSGGELKNVKTNFNLVRDELLYVDEKGTTMTASPKVVKMIDADGRKFVLTPAQNTFVEILSTEGKAVLTKHHKKTITETKPFNSATIERNFRSSDSIILIADGKATEVKSANDIYEALPQPDRLRDYVKKEKLRPKSAESWVKIVNYYNSI